MRRIIFFAVIMISAGLSMARTADQMRATPAAATTANTNAAASRVVAPSRTTVAQSSSRSVSIPRDPRGHFLTDGRINGQRVDFMIDTGASVVALNERTAARFGLRPTPGEYNAAVSTANGTIRAARTRIAMIDLGGLVVRDVEAMVLPDTALSENLLGLSFLSKLKRYEYANGKMVLEQ